MGTKPPWVRNMRAALSRIYRALTQPLRKVAFYGRARYCPVCRSQLVLKLWPDRRTDGGVTGHFFCPGCTQP